MIGVLNNFVRYPGLRIICRGPAGHGSILHPNTAAEKMTIVLQEMHRRRSEEARKIAGHPEPMTVMGDVTTINLTLVKVKKLII